MRSLLVAAAITVLGTSVVACGENSNNIGSNPTCVKVEGEPGSQPKITVPADCKAPKDLVSADLRFGDDPAARKGDNVLAHYTLYTWSDHKLQETSYKAGKPFEVEDLGEAPVIDGWNEGMIGVRAKGRRLLIVPPAKGYGPGGTGDGSIKGNETLVFVIDTVKVSPKK
ncbi:FKBP-type peptidyl-prolyl cis-trans isomerase [Pseudonocardiaceae bacterium YIM PH 21723]|nr:FKBP-type peptidyl-prolyl cis-trans isomerase [Pseudonocardiaceae bacterium YIM PH 21723]